ncbi:PQQ-binding-like beta-propeller repeat protein [Haloterrigena sp. SYSU A558-1]|uniref:PQQ-binding-like beta-propeller repeat protein n=1 Tax=Haloterrigena gelatinilytica TaxID=2741724 RepID=A0A8J8GM55_9EURY|nr:PQQ-binding-like beta-propeller repeat protein [Haloterrigena gelatinilytica]NUB90332.1 PQQ-binding-like beta-propeller repeat protein [Haloterrigena gelatinilytica]NUC73846.1 PQQ-binding-like beta-propeller repeat protein [Haloterrigena gelatinilytica]
MSDWNQFKGDPHRSGVRRDAAGPDRVTKAWTADLAGPPESPVLDRDTVFVGTRRGDCYAFERETGRRRWTVETEGEVKTAPVVGRDGLYLAVGDGIVRALDPGTGEQRWETELAGALESPLALSDGLLYAGHAAGLSALEAETGTRVWTHETETAVAGAPAVDRAADRERREWGADPDETEIDLLSLDDAEMDEGVVDRDRVYVGTDAGTVIALEADTGEKLWNAPTSGAIVDGPTVADGRVYVADEDGTLVAFHADTGQSWFTYEIRDAFTSSPTVLPAADATFAGAADGYLHVTDTTFGRRKLRGWLFSKQGVALDGPVRSSPVVAGDVLCIGDATGSLYGVDVSGDAEDCDLDWFVDLERGVAGTPALAADALFVGTDDGRLHRLEWESDRSTP